MRKIGTWGDTNPVHSVCHGQSWEKVIAYTERDRRFGEDCSKPFIEKDGVGRHDDSV